MAVADPAELPAQPHVGPHAGGLRAAAAYFSLGRRMEIARHVAEPLCERFRLPQYTNPDLLLCACTIACSSTRATCGRSAAARRWDRWVWPGPVLRVRRLSALPPKNAPRRRRRPSRRSPPFRPPGGTATDEGFRSAGSPPGVLAGTGRAVYEAAGPLAAVHAAPTR